MEDSDYLIKHDDIQSFKEIVSSYYIQDNHN